MAIRRLKGENCAIPTGHFGPAGRAFARPTRRIGAIAASRAAFPGPRRFASGLPCGPLRTTGYPTPEPERRPGAPVFPSGRTMIQPPTGRGPSTRKSTSSSQIGRFASSRNSTVTSSRHGTFTSVRRAESLKYTIIVMQNHSLSGDGGVPCSLFKSVRSAAFEMFQGLSVGIRPGASVGKRPGPSVGIGPAPSVEMCPVPSVGACPRAVGWEVSGPLG